MKNLSKMFETLYNVDQIKTMERKFAVIIFKRIFSNETAVAIGSLLINDEGDWTFQAEVQGYAGGLETLIDIYAS